MRDEVGKRNHSPEILDRGVTIKHPRLPSWIDICAFPAKGLSFLHPHNWCSVRRQAKRPSLLHPVMPHNWCSVRRQAKRPSLLHPVMPHNWCSVRRQAKRPSLLHPVMPHNWCSVRRQAKRPSLLHPVMPHNWCSVRRQAGKLVEYNQTKNFKTVPSILALFKLIRLVHAGSGIVN